MNRLITFFFILSASSSALAGGKAFSLSKGTFDTNHFAVDHTPQATLTLSDGSNKAHLEITENFCRKGEGCVDVQKVRLNQNFSLKAFKIDSCNIKYFKSQDRPSTMARSRFDRTSLMMAEIEIRDARATTCKSNPQNRVQVLVRTKTSASVGLSTLQFQYLDTELAQRPSSPDMVVRGESFLLTGI
ncbi:MAG: hypothetical protein ACXWC9_05790 [Pseudobdellovibrionaceae bacterium]